MKKTHFFILTLILLVGSFVISCKVKTKKVATNNNLQVVKEVSATDLAMSGTEKINPDQAVIIILISDIGVVNGKTTLNGKVINVEQKGFGFKANLNVDDPITIITQENVSILNNEEVRCVIEQIITPNQDNLEFRLNRLI